jgi:hypothetical protein
MDPNAGGGGGGGGLLATLGHLLLLPFKLVFALVAFVVHLVVWVVVLPLRVVFVLLRLLGAKGLAALVVGVAAGLLFAPGPGRELRDRIRAALGGGTPPDEELGDRVVFELAHAPRTWHLPQPDVAVAAGRVTLSGSVPHETARVELVATAGGVPGVVAIEDLLAVEDGTRVGAEVGAGPGDAG